MNVIFTDTESSIKLVITGEADPSGIKRFSEIVEHISKDLQKDVEIDLSEAVYMDSSSIGLLIKLHKNQKQKNLGFIISKASDRVLSLLRLCSLSDTLQ